jgi:hypothetical protein
LDHLILSADIDVEYQLLKKKFNLKNYLDKKLQGGTDDCVWNDFCSLLAVLFEFDDFDRILSGVVERCFCCNCLYGSNSRAVLETTADVGKVADVVVSFS